MTSIYKPLGDLVQLVDERNKDLTVKRNLGLSISKEFIPTVGNTVGTNMANYKVVKRNQFACSLMQVRRDKKMPVALLRQFDQVIISPAYPVFKVIDEEVLLPEYLMMWFSRDEFDRHACFLAVGGVRGSLEWDDFMEMELPVPSIEKQRAIVKEYQTVTDRIKLNEQLNQKLEETAQAIYRHWFVDFEFPNEDGLPYKSSGGDMIYNEELEKELPERWSVNSFTEVVELKGGGTPRTTEPNYWKGEIPFFTPKDVDVSYYSVVTEKNITQSGLESCSSKLYPRNTVFVTARGTVGAVSLAGEQMAMNQSCYAVLGDERIGAFYIHQLTIETIKSLKKEAVGAVFKALVTKDFNGKMVLNPPRSISKMYNAKILPIYELLWNNSKQRDALKRLSDIVLQRLSKVESHEAEQVS